MRVVYMGTPKFAVPSLKALNGSPDFDVVSVFTQPDAVSRRGNKARPTEVKRCAEELSIPVFTPSSLRDDGVAELIEEMAPDAIVVTSYGKILPKRILEIPPLGCINVHASLLPRWRGAAPIERSILDGDDVTGVSIMKMEEGLDTGPYCAQESMMIDDFGSSELSDILADMGSMMLVHVLPMIEAGTVTWTEQDEELATYASKITKEEMLLSPELTARENVLRARASTEHAPAKAVVCDRPLTVFSASEFDPEAEGFEVDGEVGPGQVAKIRKRLFLGASDRAFELKSVKPDGGRIMDAAGFCSGVYGKLKNGEGTWEAIR
ncbi:MAG: methionyl-tRNA formyltransferase [Coriobacteriales bacterium]